MFFFATNAATGSGSRHQWRNRGQPTLDEALEGVARSWYDMTELELDEFMSKVVQTLGAYGPGDVFDKLAQWAARQPAPDTAKESFTELSVHESLALLIQLIGV